MQALALAGAGFATLSAPAFAQAPQEAAAQDAGDEPQATIVVTGSILRQDVNNTPSPISVVTSESLEQRGIQTKQEALQRISSNNGAALTTSFSANGAFAAGASAVSLRGLTTSSTLVLFDGQRAAYYPLAD
ncbi:MAG TPA: TonB-dependent receptor plug domain-containing protein, partial [Sphingobium sp.]